MINDLIKNIDKIHSTELGIIRVRRNFKLKSNNVIEYCKKFIKGADNIIKSGKN